MIITIDGPTASGKTTIARMLAQHLNFFCVASGILFRGLAYVLVHEFHYQEQNIQNVRVEDINRAIDPQRFRYVYSKQQGEQLFFDGINITDQLRDKKIAEYSSLLGAQAKVREVLDRMSRNLADHQDIIAEGRDMGSVVFPHAQIKFYLTASLEVRAQRWYHDQKIKRPSLTIEQAYAEVQERDERDMNRVMAPLIIPDDAIIIDDSALSKEQVFIQMLEHIKNFLNQSR